jgi:hypothetical protein
LALARILLGHRRPRRGRNLVVLVCIAIHVAITGARDARRARNAAAGRQLAPQPEINEGADNAPVGCHVHLETAN